MLSLTKAEEKIMLVLWKLESAKVNEIIECFPDPKPATNAMSTMLGTLEKKGFVQHNRESRSFIYAPKVSKLEFTSVRLKYYLDVYFGGDLDKFRKHIDILDL